MISRLFPFLLLGITTSLNAGAPTFLRDSEQITDGKMDIDSAAWSPDSKQIAFVNLALFEGSPAGELWIFNCKTKEKHLLLNDKELKGYHEIYGYSLYGVEWVDSENLTVWISDNDVDSTLVKLATGKPNQFEVIDHSSGSDGPAPNPIAKDLKKILLRHYPKGDDRYVNLEKYPHWFHINQIGTTWLVHYLRDPDILIVDSSKGTVRKIPISTPLPGDNLGYGRLGENLIAIYSSSPIADYPKIHYTVDRIDLRGNAESTQQLFKIQGYPRFHPYPGERFDYFVYSKTHSKDLLQNVLLYRYHFGGTLEKLATEGWHNLSFNHDGKKIAFIKVMDGKRILFSGNLIED